MYPYYRPAVGASDVTDMKLLKISLMLGFTIDMLARITITNEMPGRQKVFNKC